MKRFTWYLIITAAVLYTALWWAGNLLDAGQSRFNLKVGQVAPADIIAPFSYTVFKSDHTLLAEEEDALAKLPRLYYLNNEITYAIQKKVDYLFELIEQNSSVATPLVKSKLHPIGINLSAATLNILKQAGADNLVYRIFANRLPDVLSKGIITGFAPGDTLTVQIGDIERRVTASQFYTPESAAAYLAADADSTVITAVKEIARAVLLANIMLDTKAMDEQRENVKSTLNPVLAEVLKNELIISRNTRVTNAEAQKLECLAFLLKQNQGHTASTPWHRVVSELIFWVISLWVLFKLMIMVDPLIQGRRTNFALVVACVFVLQLNCLLVQSYGWPQVFVLIGFPLLLWLSVYRTGTGVVLAAFLLVFTQRFLGGQVLFPAAAIVAALFIYSLLSRIRNPFDLLPFVFGLALTKPLLTGLAVHFYDYSWHELTTLLVQAAVSGVLTATLVLALAPLVQKKLRAATRQVLLDLLDFSYPLLKKLALGAPGTYQHSLVVGNLAEAMARAVGADPLLAKVGSFYHDIGKLDDPKIYTENNTESHSIHDKLSYEDSAARIREHIAHGLSLAKQYRLPIAVSDIISQHHGTSAIRFFYLKAKQEKPEVDEARFRYFGPRPQSKEAALVMIADVMESATRSMDAHTEQALSERVAELLSTLRQEGQLDETDLTLRDLNKIQSVLLVMLESIYHRRIEYPSNDQPPTTAYQSNPIHG